MVVGNGLLANVFDSYKDVQDVIIFASGVSNSKCTSELEFERESSLVEKYKSTNKLFIYFSTSSIEDPYLKSSKYIEHKLKIESFIKNNFSRFLIVRLPNVVGKTKNPNTLINFIFNSVNSGKQINVQLNASRYLLAIDDIFYYVNCLLEKEFEFNKVVNLIVADKLPVLEIVNAIEHHLGKDIDKKILSNAGGNYNLKCDKIFNKYGINKLVDGRKYLDELLLKYYS